MTEPENTTRDEVEAAIRSALAEYRESSGGVALQRGLTPEVMRVLAIVIAQSIPPRTYRRGCHGYLCACSGFCHQWHKLDDEGGDDPDTQ